MKQIEQLRQEVGSLRVENERLKDALNAIMLMGLNRETEQPFTVEYLRDSDRLPECVEFCTRIARAALEKEDE